MNIDTHTLDAFRYMVYSYHPKIREKPLDGDWTMTRPRNKMNIKGIKYVEFEHLDTTKK